MNKPIDDNDINRMITGFGKKPSAAEKEKIMGLVKDQRQEHERVQTAKQRINKDRQAGREI